MGGGQGNMSPHVLKGRQLRNRRGRGAGGRVPPKLLTGKFLLTYREKRGKEKRKKG